MLFIINESNKRAIYKNEQYPPYKYLNQYQVDEIVSNTYLDIFTKLTEMAKNELDKGKYDVYISGKGASITNIDKYFTNISSYNSNVVSPSYLCLSKPTYIQTVGLIRLNYKKLIENKVVVENNGTSLETKESKFDKFILDEDELN